MKNYIILNNNKVDVSNSDPNSSLLDWLRIEKDLKGTKEGCAEGDCGACSILLSPVVGGDLRPANSCLLKLGQVCGSDIFTVEGIGSQDKPNLVQNALTDFGGTQCGFCTPGFVISISSLLNKTTQPKESDIHDALAGNLCRCTGYKPIMDAIYNVEGKLDLKNCSPWMESNNFYGGESNFFYPKTVEEAYKISINNENSKYLSGGTDLNLIEPDSEFLKNFEGIGEIINIKLGPKLIKGRFLEVDNNGHLIIQENNVIKQIKFGSII